MAVSEPINSSKSGSYPTGIRTDAETSHLGLVGTPHAGGFALLPRLLDCTSETVSENVVSLSIGVLDLRVWSYWQA